LRLPIKQNQIQKRETKENYDPRTQKLKKQKLKNQKLKSSKVKNSKIKDREEVLRPRASSGVVFGFSPMSLLEAEHALCARCKHQKQKRRKLKRKPIQPKWSALDAPLAQMHPNQILTLFEWAQLNRISVRTARRIIAGGDGPVVTQLSSQRIGISVANNAAWQAARARA